MSPCPGVSLSQVSVVSVVQFADQAIDIRWGTASTTDNHTNTRRQGTMSGLWTEISPRDGEQTLDTITRRVEDEREGVTQYHVAVLWATYVHMQVQ